MVGKVKYSMSSGRDSLKQETVIERFTYIERAVGL